MKRLVFFSSLLAACGGTSVSMELQFPDEASRAETNGLQITAIEPFIAGNEQVGRSRLLLRCGQLGVFGPTAVVNRDQSELASIQTLLNREGRTFPLDGDWSVDLDRFKSSEDTNPWRAILVHVEARGPANKSEGGLSPTPEAKTLLEGCFCMRLSESATLESDMTLDQEVKEACPAVVDATPRPVVLKPVISDQFRLEAYGVQAATAPRGRQAVALPGVAIKYTTCTDDPTGNCFTCRTARCTETQDLRNVPIRVTVQQVAGTAKAEPAIILTNRSGIVVPQVQVDDCASPIVIHAEVVGRTGTGVDFPVTCVDPIDFEAKPTDKVELGLDLDTVNVAAIGTIPATSEPGGFDTPARVAVLLNGSGDTASLELYEAVGRSLSLAASVKLPGERGLGVLGFHYDLRAKTKPVLAVVTAVMNKPIVRVYRYDEASGLMELSRTTRERCDYDGCATINDCSGDMMTRPCLRNMMLSSVMPPIPMAVADRNGDGYADFSFATDREFQMYTYYSSTASPDAPPPLDYSCQCTAFGRGMPSFEVLSLGGPPEGLTAPNVDLMMGDGTGAYVRYASEDRVDGPSCSRVDPAAPACPDGLECMELCPGSAASARCVERCTVGNVDACKSSPLRPKCLSLTSTVGVCGGPGLQCRSLNSVWQLTTIHDVAKGLLSEDDVEDAIAVGAGNPVPSSGSSGSIRILYGGPVDLTNTRMLSAVARERTYVDLVARRLANNEEAQSPRGVETGDFNADGKVDLAAIYTSSEEVRVWLGGGNLVPGEIGQAPGATTGGRIKLNECAETCPSRQRCFPFPRFAVGDLDGDRRAEVVVACVPDVEGPHPTIKWFTPVVP